ncbi:type I restriction endonuclease subunit R [Spiroplasma chrysopicola]|uniref:Type I restriction enzyme endonuclease subunit n=1 Tax=Spiroplasma chrysopicola DF-1 TaxID=1276227 RepID=R4UAA7_9MOLU|nr:type I restriction endonuclease subunit R [Spiroplasma chrysopicola]AGM24839.1 type I restriction enzyme, R subunit [Spiroplasma chrysopicola DF-1]
MSSFNIISESNDLTVVSQYISVIKKANSFQSEADLEKEFINLLQDQSYEFLSVHNGTDLRKNLRKQLELLNKYNFSDDEWENFFNHNLANQNDGIIEKTKIIQEDYRQVLIRDDGSSKNINLLDKKNIHNNRLQVINQYEVKEGKYQNRYDVTILVNGFPLVHVELKRRGVAIKEAFNQINRYQKDSFWAETGLFQYVQIFVISNGTSTKYYSNTTRFNHINDINLPGKKTKTSHSFEFTSFWADANNKIIPDLIDFTKTFFSKRTLLNILTKYCVFTSENMLLVMRPYQIVATERILNRIEIATNYKKYGSRTAGGYIWHTTGSGKTLTSFKAARMASKISYIDKVLFVVDRKDLDYQTMREYDRFEEGAANSNTSTKILRKQLEDSNSKIIITTIQKLSRFITKNKAHQTFDKHVVIIFDECHRSQFGEMNMAITKHFKKYYLFGFTGTPIFTVNAGASKNPALKTTEQVFGEKLHTYTIVDAINDNNVLPFRIDYNTTLASRDDIEDQEVRDIDREKVYSDPRRIKMVTEYILDHFNQKTYRTKKVFQHNVISNVADVVNDKNCYNFMEKKVSINIDGFNSIFAVSSIEIAKLYYNEFKKQMQEKPDQNLKVGLIYSYFANEEESNGLLGEEDSQETTNLDQSSRDFLEGVIKDYNKMFSTNYDTSSDKFQNYYKDLSLRMKNKELDLLIVVNMFLTGFDATTLNTLWVDKNLKMHGLIQAFSRTNRILNSIKTFGNIVCFRNLQKQTDEAIALFGNKDASGIVLLKGFDDYYHGYTDHNGQKQKGYVEMIDELFEKYPLRESSIIGEQKQKEFITLFGAILRMRNLLTTYDKFEGNEIITERDFQDYCGRYLDLKDQWSKHQAGEAEIINDDVVFEIELLKQVEINIDYILILVEKYHKSYSKDEEILISIYKAIDSSPQLRSKKELIRNFINGINDVQDIVSVWRRFIVKEKVTSLKKIIQAEKLKEDETKKFILDCFENGIVKTTGTNFNKILPPISRFGDGNYYKTRERVITEIQKYFDQFYGLE